jgi:hypothetical protein
MTKQEAIDLITAKYPTFDVDRVTETNRYFLISIIPKTLSARHKDRPMPYEDGLKAVNKQTKEIFTYNPIRHGE